MAQRRRYQSQVAGWNRYTPRRAAARRALHLVDAENLMCGPRQPAELLHRALAAFRDAAQPAPGDQVVVAANPHVLATAGLAWPSARLLVGHGADGADRALLAEVVDTAWVATRFDRVVVGSGDGIFAPAVLALRAAGTRVDVVALRGRVANSLRRVADVVYLVPAFDLCHPSA